MVNTVVGLYESFEDAQAAIRELFESGFPRESISLVANDVSASFSNSEQRGLEGVDVRPAGESGSLAAMGAMMGGIAGMLVGLAALAIPGIGAVLAAGPVAAALGGAGVGALTGGFLGALIDSGVPETDAQLYAEGVRRGGALVTVYTPDGETADRAVQILNRHNPVNVEEKMNEWLRDGKIDLPSGETPADGAVLDGTPYEADGSQLPRRARIYNSGQR